jgi:hypothetical protein
MGRQDSIVPNSKSMAASAARRFHYFFFDRIRPKDQQVRPSTNAQLKPMKTSALVVI